MEVITLLVCYSVVMIYVIFKGGDHQVLIGVVTSFFTAALARVLDKVDRRKKNKKNRKEIK